MAPLTTNLHNHATELFVRENLNRCLPDIQDLADTLTENIPGFTSDISGEKLSGTAPPHTTGGSATPSVVPRRLVA